MIKASQLRDKMVELGTARPQDRAGCMYVGGDGKPCCIVGTALIELGLSPQRLVDDDDLNFGTSAKILFRYWSRELGLEDDLTEDQWSAIDEAQMAQDLDSPWGEAIEPLR